MELVTTRRVQQTRQFAGWERFIQVVYGVQVFVRP